MKQLQKYIIGILFTVLFFSSSIALPSGFSQGNIPAFKFSITTATSPDTFALPLEVDGTYSFIAMWGDGTNDTITVWNQAEVTHTYTTAASYNITIIGTIQGWRFNNTGDKTLINDIMSWGPLRLGNNDGYFYGCTNLTISATDKLDLTGTLNMYRIFKNANISTAPGMILWDMSSVTTIDNIFRNNISFNQDISSWDVSSVINFNKAFSTSSSSSFNQDISSWDTSSATSMANVFDGATSFDQNLAAWNITSVTNMASMFNNVTLSTVNYSAILIGWEAQVEQPNVVFSGGNSLYSAGAAATARAALVSNGWTITDGGQE